MLPPVPPGPNGAETPSPNGAGPQVPNASSPAAPAVPGGTPPMPPPAPPGPAAPPPPTIIETSNIKRRPDAADIKNPFERVATMLVDTSEDYAKRLAASLSEQPSDATEPDPSTVHQMMNFSPYGIDAPHMFWQVHDQLLQDAAANNDPDPYAVAERGALDQVYPYRAKLALLDVLAPEEKVKRAQELMRISDQQNARGHTVESMPHVVGPAGLPRDQASLPEPSPKGGAY